MYPIKPREWQERTRGHIEINEADCILCGICAKRCPTLAINVDKAARTCFAYSAEHVQKTVPKSVC